MTNKEIAELMFEKMRGFGFTPYDISYGDGYFIFEMGENSVVYFKIKEVWKNWQFGMWIYSDELNNYKEDENNETPYEKEPNVVHIFCQHEHLIDKFKPSRSALCVSYKPCDFTHDYNYSYYELDDMLKMIKYHPIMCWNEFCGSHAGYYGYRSFLLPFIKYELGDYLVRKIDKKVKTAFWLNYTKAKLFLMKKFSKILYDVELYDFEKENEGWSTDYLYKIKLTFNDVDTDKILDFFDFWFKRTEYGKFAILNHVVELDTMYHVKGDEEPHWVDFK
jgi:hypothetical protein